jgi:ubiquinone/menaquinone biosynthesis C-methylase UbiE
MAEQQGYLPALRFKSLTPAFDLVVRHTTRERELKRRLIDQARVPPEGHVLDVGAGTGTLAIALARRHPEARVTGLDADPEILAIARRKAAAAGAHVELVEAMSTALPFPDASFDRVVSTLFFHHLDHDGRRRSMAEIARVLAPGGELHAGDWGKPADPLQAALFPIARAFDGFARTADNAAGALPRMFAEAGLDDARVRDRLRTPLGTLDLISASKPS